MSNIGLLQWDIKGYTNCAHDIIKLKWIHHTLFAKLREIINEEEKKEKEIDNTAYYILNTWGDAVFIHSESYILLANIARRIREFFEKRNKGYNKLPDRPQGIGKLSVRIALHAAEATYYTNPITNRQDVFGKDVILPSRIEPACPPNAILVSFDFFDAWAKSQGKRCASTKDFEGFDGFLDEEPHLTKKKEFDEPDDYLDETTFDEIAIYNYLKQNPGFGRKVSVKLAKNFKYTGDVYAFFPAYSDREKEQLRRFSLTETKANIDTGEIFNKLQNLLEFLKSHDETFKAKQHAVVNSNYSSCSQGCHDNRCDSKLLIMQTIAEFTRRFQDLVFVFEYSRKYDRALRVLHEVVAYSGDFTNERLIRLGNRITESIQYLKELTKVSAIDIRKFNVDGEAVVQETPEDDIVAKRLLSYLPDSNGDNLFHVSSFLKQIKSLVDILTSSLTNLENGSFSETDSRFISREFFAIKADHYKVIENINLVLSKRITSLLEALNESFVILEEDSQNFHSCADSYLAKIDKNLAKKKYWVKEKREGN